MNKKKITNKLYKLSKTKWFTLVELIIVITILAILWTIAFISFQWYSEQTRDSTRISNISIIKSSLELFSLDSGKYPLPTDWINVTYSWAVVWKQGTFWDSTFKNVDKLNIIPVDPLTNSQYTYSITLKWNEYELAWITETNGTAKINTLDETYAWEINATAFVTWNYNWLLQKTLSWSNCYVFSLPTIIANDLETSNEIEDIINNNRLVYNWFNNLPSSYKNSKFKLDWWFNFTPNKFISYTDTNNCNPLYDSVSNTARTNLITNLQESYSGTILETKDRIKEIVNVDLWNIWEITQLWANIINNTLWGKVEAVVPTWLTSWTPSTSSPTVMVSKDWTINLWWIPDNIAWVVLEWDVTWFINSQTEWWWYGWVWVATVNGTIMDPSSLTGSKIPNTNPTMTWTWWYTRITLTQINKQWSTFKDCTNNADLNLWFNGTFPAPAWWSSYDIAPIDSTYETWYYWVPQGTSAYWSTPNNAAQNYWVDYIAVPWETCTHWLVGYTWWLMQWTAHPAWPSVKYCPGSIISTLCNAENNTARCPSSPPTLTQWPLDNKYDLTFTWTWFNTTTWDSDRPVTGPFSTVNWWNLSITGKIQLVNDVNWMYSNQTTWTCWGTANWPEVRFGTYDRKEIIF